MKTPSWYRVEATCLAEFSGVWAYTPVLRYDNEAGKGDHRHRGNLEEPYRFSTPRQLLKDFNDDITRWRDENSDD